MLERSPARRWTTEELDAAVAKVRGAHNPPPKAAPVKRAKPPPQDAERRVDRLSLVLPWPPSANAAYYHGARGMLILTDAHKTFRAEVLALWWARGRPWLDGRLEVRLGLHAPDRRSIDIDNRAKHAIDALQHAGFFENDSAIDVLLIERGAVAATPAVAVTIATLAKDEPCQLKLTP